MCPGDVEMVDQVSRGSREQTSVEMNEGVVADGENVGISESDDSVGDRMYEWVLCKLIDECVGDGMLESDNGKSIDDDGAVVTVGQYPTGLLGVAVYGAP